MSDKPMRPKHLKGVVLAAGLGTRLRPLTNLIPKPLVPFCGIPMLELAFTRFSRLKLEGLAANAHYHADKVQSTCLALQQSHHLNSPIEVSIEPELLGSGGVYDKLKPWIKNSDVLAANGDIVSDFSLQPLIQQHSSTDALVTLGLVMGQNPKGKSIWIDPKTHRIIAIDYTAEQNPFSEMAPKAHVFSGFQIITNEVIQQLPEGEVSDIISIYCDLLKEKKPLYGQFQDCFWHDLGTPEGYLAAHKDFFSYLFSNPKHFDQVRKDETGLFESYRLQKISLCISLEEKLLQKINPEHLDDFLVANPNIKIQANHTFEFSIQGTNFLLDQPAIEPSVSIGPNCVIHSAEGLPKSSHISSSVLQGKFAAQNLRDSILIHGIQL